VTVALLVYTVLMLSVSRVSWIVYRHNHRFDERPLFTKADRFRDLTNYVGKTAHLLGGAATLGRGYPVYTYPAPAAFVYKALIYAVPGYGVVIYLTFLAICTLGFAIAALRASRGSRWVGPAAAVAIVATAVFGYPLWFDADRGNIEGVVWAMAAVGLCFLLRARYRAAAVLIGLAASIKPFSILFLLLLLARRRYKEAALGVVTAGLVILAALTALGPNPWKAYQGLKPGVSLYLAEYVTNLAPAEEARFDHSLLDGMKSAALTVEMGGIRPRKAIGDVETLNAEPGGWPVIHTLVRVYPFVAMAGLGLLVAVFRKLPMLNQLTALGVAITLFPLAAGDYTLLHLYVPFGALVVFMTREAAAGRSTLAFGSLLAFAVTYALLFAPLTFLAIYAGDAKLLLLLALLVVAAVSPMPSEYFGDPAGEVQREQTGEIGPDAAGLLAS
jgi:hypothetical protein